MSNPVLAQVVGLSRTDVSDVTCRSDKIWLFFKPFTPYAGSVFYVIFLGSDHRKGNVHLCIRFIFNCSVKLCSLIHNESRRLFSHCSTAAKIPALCLITTRYTHTHTQRTGPVIYTHTLSSVPDSFLITLEFRKQLV